MKPHEQDTLHKSTAAVRLLHWVLIDVWQDMAQLRVEFQEVLQVKEEQEDVLHRRERELGALKGALKEEVETHDSYMAALKEEYENELEKLVRDLDLAKEVTENTHISTLYQTSLCWCRFYNNIIHVTPGQSLQLTKMQKKFS